MAFVIFCDNKGCKKPEQEPLLDVATNKVYCSECGGEIKSVTTFAKASMRGMGQVKREAKSQQAFSVKCNGCSKTNQPLLKKTLLLCPNCGREHDGIPKTYAHAIKQFLMTNVPKSKNTEIE